MRHLVLLPTVLVGLLGGAPLHAAPLWTVEQGSDLRFVASQQGQPVEGRFADFAATIAFDPTDLASSHIDVEIDVASVDTGHGDRDTALRSEAFFDVASWPTARFVGERIAHLGGASYEVEGRLQIRDVDQAVTLPFELVIEDHPEDTGRLLARATGELTISRLAYGVGRGEWASTTTVGDEVTIRLSIVASRPR